MLWPFVFEWIKIYFFFNKLFAFLPFPTTGSLAVHEWTDFLFSFHVFETTFSFWQHFFVFVSVRALYFVILFLFTVNVNKVLPYVRIFVHFNVIGAAMRFDMEWFVSPLTFKYTCICWLVFSTKRYCSYKQTGSVLCCFHFNKIIRFYIL